MVNWPTYTIMPVIVPLQMQHLQDFCSKFYNSKYNGRTLQWQHSLANTLVKATFKPNVSLFFFVYTLCTTHLRH